LLAERPDPNEQVRHRLLSRYRAHGLLGERGGQGEIWIGAGSSAAERYARQAELREAGRLVPIEVEGVTGTRLALAEELPMLEEAARAVATGRSAGDGIAFLAPLDPFVWDRRLLRSLFDFDYVWEVYVPAAKRRWGYYVLPILAGDRLVGRIEPRIDRSAGALRVLDLWWEAGFDPSASSGFVDGLVEALEAHARFADVTRIAWPRSARHRALGSLVRSRLGPRGRVRERS
jgi:uncharacterized protein YcaQ